MIKKLLLGTCLVLFLASGANAYKINDYELTTQTDKTNIQFTYDNDNISVQPFIVINTNIVVCAVYGWEFYEDGCYVKGEKAENFYKEKNMEVITTLEERDVTSLDKTDNTFKFSYDYKTLPAAEQISYIGLELVTDLPITSFTKNTLNINDNIVYNYSDLIYSGFTVKLDKFYNILIDTTSRTTANLDPTFEFHNAAIDYVAIDGFSDNESVVYAFHETGSDDISFIVGYLNGTEIRSIIDVDSSSSAIDGMVNVDVCVHPDDIFSVCYVDSGDDIMCASYYKNGTNWKSVYNANSVSATGDDPSVSIVCIDNDIYTISFHDAAAADDYSYFTRYRNSTIYFAAPVDLSTGTACPSGCSSDSDKVNNEIVVFCYDDTTSTDHVQCDTAYWRNNTIMATGILQENLDISDDNSWLGVAALNDDEFAHCRQDDDGSDEFVECGVAHINGTVITSMTKVWETYTPITSIVYVPIARRDNTSFITCFSDDDTNQHSCLQLYKNMTEITMLNYSSGDYGKAIDVFSQTEFETKSCDATFVLALENVTDSNNGYTITSWLNGTSWEGYCVEAGTPPADTCTYVAGDWYVDCSDNCVITDNVNVNGDLILYGSGEFSIGATSTIEARRLELPDSCSIIINDGSKLALYM